MLAATVGMLGFYITMFKKTRPLIGRKTVLYLLALLTTTFLIVWAMVMKFSSPLPNIIAQLVNSSGYTLFILVNNYVIHVKEKKC